MKKALTLILAILLTFALAACASAPVPTAAPIPSALPTPEPTSEPTPTSTPENPDEMQIDEALLEAEIKKAIIKITKEKFEGYGYENPVYAEGHKTLRSEIKENQIYAYVDAEFGVYTKENGQWYDRSGSAGPLILIFSIRSNNNYEYDSFIQALIDGDVINFVDEFPSDLVSEYENTDYGTDFFQDQINSYLD